MRSDDGLNQGMVDGTEMLLVTLNDRVYAYGWVTGKPKMNIGFPGNILAPKILPSLLPLCGSHCC